MPSNDRSFPMFSLVYNVLAVPYNFLIGFVVGVAAPLAAIAAVVFDVRFLTGQMPFLSLRQEEEGERRLSLELVAPDAATELYAAEKEKIMDDLESFRAEMKAMMEEAQAAAEEAAEEEAA